MDVNESTVGEPLEEKIERWVSNKEKIKDGAPRIFTARKDGVMPQYDIRTDRNEIAIDATTKIEKSYKARREEKFQIEEGKNAEGKSISTNTEAVDSPEK